MYLTGLATWFSSRDSLKRKISPLCLFRRNISDSRSWPSSFSPVNIELQFLHLSKFLYTNSYHHLFCIYEVFFKLFIDNPNRYISNYPKRSRQTRFRSNILKSNELGLHTFKFTFILHSFPSVYSYLVSNFWKRLEERELLYPMSQFSPYKIKQKTDLL